MATKQQSAKRKSAKKSAHKTGAGVTSDAKRALGVVDMGIGPHHMRGREAAHEFRSGNDPLAPHATPANAPAPE
jgi:hypothetical protein